MFNWFLSPVWKYAAIGAFVYYLLLGGNGHGSVMQGYTTCESRFAGPEICQQARDAGASLRGN